MTRSNNPQNAIHYRVALADPAGHLFEVSLSIARPDADGQVLSLPALAARQLPDPRLCQTPDQRRGPHRRRHSRDRRADGQEPLASGAAGPAGDRQLQVYAWDLSVRGGYLDDQRAFFNGSALLLCVEGQQNQPCQLELQPPSQPALADWQVATAMRPDAVDSAGFGRYQADDYDELIDPSGRDGRLYPGDL